MIARRRLSTLPTESDSTPPPPPPPTDAYVGRLKDTIRGVKLLSVSSCIVTSVAAPIIMATNSASVAANVTACAFAAFGLFTTGLLTWATSPYVIRMRYLTAERQFEVESLNAIARIKQTRFSVDEIEKKAESRRVAASMRPFVTFGVKGKRQLFFVHPEDLPSHWQNKLT